MDRQMSWLPLKDRNGIMALHLRTASNEAWKPYTSFPEIAIPDHPVPGGSKGYATYQKLRLQGWNLAKTPQGYA